MLSTAVKNEVWSQEVIEVNWRCVYMYATWLERKRYFYLLSSTKQNTSNANVTLHIGISLIKDVQLFYFSNLPGKNKSLRTGGKTKSTEAGWCRIVCLMNTTL